MSRETLFHIPFPSKEMTVEFYKKSKGKGGQKINKTANACRIKHIPSNTLVSCHAHRSQAQNKKEALQKLVNSKSFKIWLKIEVAARLAGYTSAAEKTEKAMHPGNLRIEVMHKGKWVPEGRGKNVR